MKGLLHPSVERPTRVLCALLLLLLALRPVAVRAYDGDVHFYLTYVLARLAALSDPQASLIAQADQSMDDNRTTTAFALPLPPLHYRRHGEQWHAFNSSQTAVMQRFHELQCRAGVRTTADRGIITTCDMAAATATVAQLIDLGQFLHYYEDTYAHSNHDDVTSAWSTYHPTFGHIFEGVRPDLVANRPALAKLMAWDVFCALKTFAADHGATQPRYASRAQIDALVTALARAYDPDPRTDSVARPSAAGTPGPAKVYHQVADLHAVRCALSAFLQDADLLTGEPDVRDVGYQPLRFDEAGNPLPAPAELQPTLRNPLVCPR